MGRKMGNHTHSRCKISAKCPKKQRVALIYSQVIQSVAVVIPKMIGYNLNNDH